MPSCQVQIRLGLYFLSPGVYTSFDLRVSTKFLNRSPAFASSNLKKPLACSTLIPLAEGQHRTASRYSPLTGYHVLAWMKTDLDKF